MTDLAQHGEPTGRSEGKDTFEITLTQEQRDYLVGVLQNSQKKYLVEEHRTRAPSYREYVLQEEDLLAQILKKLGSPPTPAQARHTSS